MPTAEPVATLAPLDLEADVVTLTAALCDIPSVSRDEDAIATAIHNALRPLPHLNVTRHGNTVVARTDLGRHERVVLAVTSTRSLSPIRRTCRRAGWVTSWSGAAPWT